MKGKYKRFENEADMKENYKSLIAKKNFNLDVSYNIDIDAKLLNHDLACKIRPLISYAGKVLSFNEILAVFNEHFYYEMFGLKKGKHQINNIENTVVHSLKAYFEDPNSIP